MTYEWYDEDGNKMKCQKSEYTITKNNEEEVYICVVTDQNERLREYEFTLYPETGFVPRGYINGKAGNTSTVEANSTIKLEVKVKSEEGVTYQWYSASGDFVEDKLEGETTPVLSVAIAKESEEYQCLVTKGNERKWVYFELEVCDHTDIEVLPAVPATCEKDGLTEGKRCKECGETIVEQEVVKATGHKWDNGIITKPATATETGVKTFTCTVCKKTKTEVIQKLTTNNTVNNDTTKKPETIETSLKTGTKVTDKKSKAVYKVTGDNVDNLSAAKDDSQDLPGRIDWVAFKNQFFSSVFIAEQDFDKVSVKSKMEQQGSGYIKDYSAEMNTFFDPTGKEPTEMYFYFGPNHFKTLKALDKGRDEKWELHRLVYLGWPLIRWINQFITINVFDWLSGWGLSMGIVLLILTIMVKVVVYPATWKTYMSSAKMRVLKPKIDEINKKYPKQEDAMKKQQEVMGLYSQYGVSPMGGCLPMLLQFPILMALFMFVPSAIELRQQSFLWADDLSTYDAIITFPFHIPFLGNHLSLFCLLMTVTNILNTKYTMSMQDTGAQPQMAAMKWMMYLMPIMFLFVLNDYPSGLNYYYFVSTLISVGTMILLRKTTDETKLLAILEAKKKDPKQMKKTGFAARLEAMQKQQEQLQQQRQNKK